MKSSDIMQGGWQRRAAAAGLVGLGGCNPSFVTAPYGSTVSMPSDVVVGWTDDLNRYDLAGFPILFNVVVLDELGETPLPHIAVEISSGYSGVYVLPLEAIEVVGYPQVAPGVESAEDVREYCTDEDGNYALNEDWCAWYYDLNGDQFYAFTGGYADGYTEDSGGQYYFGPTLVRTQTDRNGVARMAALVDTVPIAGGTFQPVEIYASIGTAAGSFVLDFAGESAEDTE